MPAFIYLLLFFFLDVMQPILFMQKELAAAGALEDPMPMVLLGVPYELVIALVAAVAFFAFVPVE